MVREDHLAKTKSVWKSFVRSFFLKTMTLKVSWHITHQRYFTRINETSFVTIGQRLKKCTIQKRGLGMIYHHRNDEGSFDASISKKWGNAYKGKKIAKGYYTRVLHFSCVSNSLKMWNIIIWCPLCLLLRRKTNITSQPK